MRTADVFAFIPEQRRPRRGATVLRLEDGEAGLAARTIKRRLASLSSFSPTWLPAKKSTWSATPSRPGPLVDSRRTGPAGVAER